MTHEPIHNKSYTLEERAKLEHGTHRNQYQQLTGINCCNGHPHYACLTPPAR